MNEGESFKYVLIELIMNLSNRNTALHSSIFFSSQPVGVLQKKR